MKKLLLMALTVAPLLMACSSDDDESISMPSMTEKKTAMKADSSTVTTLGAELVGKWELLMVTRDIIIGAEVRHDTVTYAAGEHFAEFTADGRFYYPQVSFFDVLKQEKEWSYSVVNSVNGGADVKYTSGNNVKGNGYYFKNDTLVMHPFYIAFYDDHSLSFFRKMK